MVAGSPPPGDRDRAPGPVQEPRPTPAELGTMVRTAREAAGRSIDDVAARTRIRGGLIRSMESGDFAPCGGAVYARGHLRSLALATDADPSVFVTAYDRMAGAPPSATVVAGPVKGPRTARITGGGSDAGVVAPVSIGPATTSGGLALGDSSIGRGLREPRASNWTLAMIAVAVVVVIIAGVALIRPGHSSTGTSHIRAASVTPSVTPTPSPTMTATPPSTVTLADAGVNVTVRVGRSASWVHVEDASGALVFQGILQPGQTMPFHSAVLLRFVFGFAPSIDLVVNGHDVGVPPSTGGSEVADAVFTPTSGSGTARG